MDQTQHSLKPVNPSDTVSVAIDFAEIWFDIDQNGQRRDTEKILPLFEQSMGWDATSRRKRHARNAKKDWSVTIVLICQIRHGCCTHHPFSIGLQRLFNRTFNNRPNYKSHDSCRTVTKFLSFRQIDHVWTDKFIQIIEIFSVFLVILEQTPDSELSRSTQQHLLQIIAHNWIFWARVAKETDDNLEWISDTRQTTPLGLDLPPNRGAIWLTVLADFEALVKGRLLLRHRQLGDWASAKLGYTCRIPVPLIRLGFFKGLRSCLVHKREPFSQRLLKTF